MDDNNLITLLQQGDRNAYKQLFIKYYSPLCEYASQYISDDDSEELVQELMLFLWETRENLVIETSLKFLICRDILEILSVYLHQASLPQCDQEKPVPRTYP